VKNRLEVKERFFILLSYKLQMKEMEVKNVY
jgi:hypothetical protein